MSFRDRLIDYDPATKTQTTFHDLDGDGERFAIATQSDVTDLLDMNKRQYADVDERARWGEKSWVAARIDLVTYFDLLKKGIANDKKAFAKWLDDPANIYYRVRPGKLSR